MIIRTAVERECVFCESPDDPATRIEEVLVTYDTVRTTYHCPACNAVFYVEIGVLGDPDRPVNEEVY